MQKWFGVLALMAAFATWTSNFSNADQRKSGVQAVEKKAVSLKVLQEELARYRYRKACPPELLHLDGLKKIIGYVVDETNHDLIIIGSTDPQLPSLYLDDLVVALRNAFYKYARKEGKILYYSFPGCSIDPFPETLKKIMDLKEQQPSSAPIEEIKAWMERCIRVWKSPQEVRVMGVPFTSHFAWVMVSADYEMKKLTDDVESLQIPGLINIRSMVLEMQKKQSHNKDSSMPLSFISRFWFYPGENYYREDKGVEIIERCTVKLLTEEEHLAQAGRRVGTGHAHPMAREFAQRFTDRYRQIAQQRPIFAELENLFRFQTLAQIMKFKGAPEEAGLSLNYFLETYPVFTVAVSPTLPGTSSFMEYRERRPVAGGYEIHGTFLTSCGGVGMEIKVAQDSFSQDLAGRLAAIRQQVLHLRPSPQTLSWEVLAEWDAILNEES